MEQGDAIEYFLNNPREIGYVDCEGDTHLHLAARAGDSEVVEFLINNGVDVNAVNSFGDTPILMVTPGDDRMRKVVDLLIREGANVTHKNRRGINALILFRKKFMPRSKKWFGREVCRGLRCLDISDIEMATLLREAKWPIRCALWTRKPSVTDLMIKMGEDVNATDQEGLSALLEAAAIRDCAQVALLIKRGANIHQKTVRWGNALSIAVMSGIKGTSSIKIMSMLMDRGLNPNEIIPHTEYDAESPFQLALLYGNQRTVEFLVESGGNLRYVDSKGRTALHLVACNQDIEVMNILQRSNTVTNWDVRSFDGLNAFHFAAWSGNTKVAKILQSNGTKIDGKTNMGVTPLMYALMSYTSHNFWPADRRPAIKKNLILMIQFLLYNGARVDEETMQGQTPLSFAYRKMTVARILLRRLAFFEIMQIGVSEKDMYIIYSKDELRDYFNSCTAELRKMKACKVYEGLSMLRILKGTSRDFAQWTADEKIKKAFNEKITDFSIYRRMVEAKFCKSVQA
ncbi:hypothetical protein TSAR_009278 [Trichomalopsis sarcophagae]|uniref:Uncharacterized protein n=1 Tax=Trichomalopsis sarcophagae TaxID=543379 RepID=A0A232FE61_9HYME|nr:hypothetical protein TSAR_009278 [Trichomalopsis sarcophagae]